VETADPGIPDTVGIRGSGGDTGIRWGYGDPVRIRGSGGDTVGIRGYGGDTVRIRRIPGYRDPLFAPLGLRD
jgi:hypothetical protein